MKVFSKGMLGALAALLLATPAAHALATLRISANSGVNWLRIRDFDGNGNLAFSGTIGESWTIAIDANTKPATGDAAFPIMDISSTRMSSASAGTLIIEFSDTFYGPIPDGNSFSTSLTSDNMGAGRTTLWTSMGAADTLFDQPSLLGFILETGPTTFSMVSSDPLTGLGEFSLTMRLSIRHSEAQDSTFSANLVDPPPAVPEGGSSVLFLGFGLLSMAIVSRFRKSLQA